MSTKDKPRVYSYARFSSPEQAKGDSERRQWEAAREYAKSNNFAFDDSLRMSDRGLSGFHGTHRKRGALGDFLEKVKSGVVLPGSILVVENIDRLGREPVSDALETIVFGLIKHSITVETLFPRDTFTKDSINTGGIWRLIAHIERAHAESKRKSDLAQANWTQKRKIASATQMLTARAPAWFKIVVKKENNRVVSRNVSVIPEAAETIRKIFQLKLDGFGKFAIEKKLNQTAPWTPPKNKKGKGGSWRASYIEKILHNRAVLGEYQPHKMVDGKRIPHGDPIPNYFQPVVDANTFHAVQKRLNGNKGSGGKTGKATNVFQNLVKCGYCGGSMVFIDKGESPKGGKYLVCDNARRGHGCSTHSVRYDEFQETMLNNLSKLRPETVLPKADEQAQQAKALRNAVAGLAAEMKEIEIQISNFVDQIGSTSNATFRARYEQRAAELEAKKVQVEAERAKKEDALRELERAAQSFDKWQANLTGLKKAIAKDVETRIRLKAHLKEFITRIEVFGRGHVNTVEHCEGMLLEEYLPELAKAKSYPAFRRYMQKRLLSPDARFFRLHLRSARPNSAGLQIAPESSLAASYSLVPDAEGFRGYTFPKVTKLLHEFFDKRKPGFMPKASQLKMAA